MTNAQTLEVPNNSKLTNAFAKFGATAGFDPKPFNQCSIIFAAKQGAGKTSLITLAENSLWLDLDNASATSPTAKATRIPFMSSGAGEYTRLEQLVDQLVEMAQKQDPNRPKWVIFDTADSLLKLCQDWVIDEAEKQRLKDQEKEFRAWRDKPIRRLGDVDWGYQRMYDAVWPVIYRVRQSGYGLILTTYMTTDKVETGSGANVKIELQERASLPPKLWEMVKGCMDYVVGMDSVTTRRPSKTIQLKGAGGKPIIGKDGQPKTKITEWTQGTERYVTFVPVIKDDKLDPFPAKFRIPMPDRITLLQADEGHPDVAHPGNFQLLEDAYNQSVENLRRDFDLSS